MPKPLMKVKPSKKQISVKKEKQATKEKATKSEKKKKEKKKRENPIKVGWEDIANDKDLLKFSLYYIP